MAASLFLFFTFGGTSDLEVSQPAYTESTSTITPQCISKQDKLYNLYTDLQNQANSLDNQLNSIGQSLSGSMSPGETESIDELASKVSSDYLAHVQNLELQYRNVEQRLSTVQASMSSSDVCQSR